MLFLKLQIQTQFVDYVMLCKSSSAKLKINIAVEAGEYMLYSLKHKF